MFSVTTHTHNIVEGISQAVSVGATVNSLVSIMFPGNLENFKVILFIDIFIVMNNN